MGCVWERANIQAAVRDVIMCNKLEKLASMKKSRERKTLRTHIKKARFGEGVSKKLSRKPVLSLDQEEELQAIVLDTELKLVEITQNDVRLVGFLRRHPRTSIRVPEPTLIQRAIGFNKAKLDMFMSILESTLFDENG